MALIGLAASILISPARAFEPATNFALHCRGCHLAHGEGVPGQIPDLRATFVALARRSAGRQYLLSVPGVAQAALDDTQLALLLNWMLDGIGPAEGAGDVARFTAAEVHRGRARPLADVGAARRQVMAELAHGGDGPP